MYKRIKYVSEFAQGLTEAEIQKLVDKAVLNNKKNEITGMLLVAEPFFFQVFEGPKDHVDALFDKISNDDRHKNIEILRSEENQTSRLFSDWAMESLVLGQGSKFNLKPLQSLLGVVVQSRQQSESLLGVIERSMISQLRIVEPS